MDDKESLLRMAEALRERQAMQQARHGNQPEQKAEPPLQQDFFELDIPLLEFAFKDDIESMEAPIYSLSTKIDNSVFHWQSADGKKAITVSPSVDAGRATIFDKDVLIYCTSQLVAAMDKGESSSRRVRFTAHAFFKATGRGTSGDEYKRFEAAMNRLRGTSIKIQDVGEHQRRAKGFGLIDSWEVVESTVNGRQRMVKVECVLSEWLFSAIENRKILTINPEYFMLRKPIERRLYEIARKHCGKQTEWKINLDQLREKCGVQDALRNFRAKIRSMEEDQPIPDYAISLQDGDMVAFSPKCS